ncbi:CDP-alcohol phosphatidyltransferase family protein [Marinobacterium maritimum]|uniref:CDP-alcohol phosphatidyltransferase family protein n=1 Tax=Marinobacterium maritimum TaxID=500162 RepID=A0ABN1I354_9GAMM
MMQDAESNRRPLAVRSLAISHRIARWLSRRQITPNQISVMSVVFAALGFVSLLGYASLERGAFLLLLAAICIQLRLLCNLFDGMVAVEGGQQTPAGELFNDLPDRIADPLFIIGAGLVTQSAYGMPLAWGCALLAVMTAYVRVLGVSMGGPADFRGPMAKQHRMALLTLAFITLSALELTQVLPDIRAYLMESVLVLMLVGLLATLWRRVQGIYRYHSNNPS